MIALKLLVGVLLAPILFAIIVLVAPIAILQILAALSFEAIGLDDWADDVISLPPGSWFM